MAHFNHYVEYASAFIKSLLCGKTPNASIALVGTVAAMQVGDVRTHRNIKQYPMPAFADSIFTRGRHGRSTGNGHT